MTVPVKETLLLKFEITGNLRYLSHLETAEMFKRALLRSGLNMAYSQGFNPRPGISLPLPRTVGIASKGDILRVSIINEDDPQQIIDKISAQLPQDCTILQAQIVPHSTKVTPTSGTYVIPFENTNNAITQAVEKLSNSLKSKQAIMVTRPPRKSKPPRTFDIAQLLESVSQTADQININYRITPGGSPRIDELMNLLEITPADITAPILRDAVHWNVK